MRPIERKTSGAIAAIPGIIASAVLAFLVLAGCNNPGSHWVGTWQGSRNLQPKPGEDPTVIGTLSRVTLTVRQDGSFEYVEVGVPRTGDAILERDTLTLKIKTFMDRPISQLGEGAVKMNEPLVVKRLPDGSAELEDPAAILPEKIVLRKLPQRQGP